jgi:hypothetical protein
MLSRTDLSLILSAFSALAIVLGAMAAVVLAAFLAGLLIGRRHDRSEVLALGCSIAGKVVSDPLSPIADDRSEHHAADQTHNEPEDKHGRRDRGNHG